MDAGQILGIDVLDHIVIGDGVFVSLQERELVLQEYSRHLSDGTMRSESVLMIKGMQLCRTHAPVFRNKSRSASIRWLFLIVSGVAFVAMIAIQAAVCAQENRNALIQKPLLIPSHDGSLADPNICYVGRWDRSDPNVRHSYWTGAYLRTSFTGTSVGIRLAAGTGLAVGIDGEPLRTISAGSGTTALNTAPMKPGVHTLLVGSPGQNEELSFLGLALAPGGVTHPVSAKPIIEFVGDSISAGVHGNYCWLTGEALGADHTQISFSGRALTSNYGCSDNKDGLDVQYFRLKNFNHLDEKPPVDWTFSYTPKVIVINLGQNDQCGSESNATMTASYVRFLRAIRVKFPHTELVALRPLSGAYEAAIRRAVMARTMAGDKRVHFIDTTNWLGKDDFIDGIHPNDGGNVKVARHLAPLLRPLLTGTPIGAMPAQVTVGDPKDPGHLAQQILNAYIGGARHIVVRPGIYRLPNVGQTAVILDGWENATLSGSGVTLILTDLAWMHDGIDLNHCTNVTVQGFTLSQDQITSYQGRVVAVGKGDDGKPYCDWRPDKGYPIPPDNEKGFLGGDVNIVDARARLLKVGCGDFYGVTAEHRSDGTFRAHMDGHFSVGDWLVGRYGDAPFKVFLNNSWGCTIKDVTMMRNGFSPIREDNGGGNHLIHCVWALGPRPSGATEGPLVTNAADGFHSTGANPGPDIEGCVMKGVFLDDNFAIHGGFQTVKSATGDTVMLDGGIGSLAVGQPVRISDDKGFYAEGTVTALKDNGNGTTTATLDKDLGIPMGAKLSNPLRDGAGFKIINCRLGRTRSRGILVKADNGLIKDNIIEGCGMSAVSIGPEYYWGEADYAHHVTIEGNTLRGNGGATYGGAAILVHGDGAIGNQDIIIRQNKMISDYQGEAQIEWSDGVTFTENTITGASPLPAMIQAPALIALSNCRNITLRGNCVRSTSAYQKQLVSIGQNVTGVQNNDQAGLNQAGATHPF